MTDVAKRMKAISNHVYLNGGFARVRAASPMT